MIDRNEDDSLIAASSSSESNIIDGIKGKTPLFNLRTFSWTRSQTIDPMHELSVATIL